MEPALDTAARAVPVVLAVLGAWVVVAVGLLLVWAISHKP
jgi:hypothetical protein